MSISTKTFKDIQVGDKFVCEFNGKSFAAIKLTSRSADVVIGEDFFGDNIWEKWTFKGNDEYITSEQIVLC